MFGEVPIPKPAAILSIPTILSNLVSLLCRLADTHFAGLLNALFTLYGLSCAQLVSEFCVAVIGGCMLLHLPKKLGAESSTE